MEQAILVCVVLLAVALAAALVRERQWRMALQLLLRRLIRLRRSPHEDMSDRPNSTDRRDERMY